MINRCKTWLNKLPLQDEVELQLSFTFQIVLIIWIVLTTPMTVMLLLSLLLPPPPSPTPGPSISAPAMIMLYVGLITLWLSPIIALDRLRRGYFRQSVLVACFGMLLPHVGATYTLGVTSPAVALLFQIPLAIASLLGGRRLLFSIAGLNILFFVSLAIVQLQSVQLTEPADSDIPGLIISAIIAFVIVTLLLATLLERVGTTLTTALKRSSKREADLQAIRASLEERVAERTADLQLALGEVEMRATNQAELLERIDFQEAAIKELSMPIIPVDDDILVMPLIGTLDSAGIEDLQARGLEAIERTRVRMLLLDITGVSVVDTQVAKGIVTLAQSVRLLGAEVVLVGVRPEVAQTIIGLGIDLENLRTFSTLQTALVHAKETPRWGNVYISA
jgi:rsbT co-antagonist protein RsbR